MIVDWIGFASVHVHMIEKWLAVRELTLSDYLDHLCGGCVASDGCEVWCFSLATDRPVNIIQESEVWSTAKEGIDFQHTMILMTSYTDGFLCISEDDAESILPQPVAILPLVVQLSLVKSIGRPVILPCESSSDSGLQDDSSQISTDPSDHMDQEVGVHLPPPVIRCAIPCTCLVCGDMVSSGLGLERHMKSLHPLHKPYDCDQCGAVFNNKHELGSHQANLHKRKKSCMQALCILFCLQVMDAFTCSSSYQRHEMLQM